MRGLLVVALLLLPSIAFAAPRTFEELADMALIFLNAGIGVALIAAIAVYFYGVSTSIHKITEGDGSQIRAHFLWGIIALFVMFSVWGILALLRNTLFSDGSYGLDSYDQTECASFDDCDIDLDDE